MDERTRRLVVEVDADDIEWAATSAKETVPRLVAMAVADAMVDWSMEDCDQPYRVTVDGESFLIVTTVGETEESTRTLVLPVQQLDA